MPMENVVREMQADMENMAQTSTSAPQTEPQTQAQPGISPLDQMFHALMQA